MRLLKNSGYGWAPLAIVFSLPPILFAQQEVEEIRVVATPQDETIAELAQSVTVLGGEALQRVQSTNLGETLAGELGVSASSFSAAASRPIIRGLAGARVKMMEDGIDSLDISTVSVDHAVGIDPLVAEQIEIFRGPTTLLFGSGAVGGVVNTVTRRIPESAPDDGFEGAFEIRGDTVADDRTGAVRLDGGGDSFAWHFDALRRDASDYAIPGSAELNPHESEAVTNVLENSGFQTTSASAGVSWFGKSTFLGVSVSGFESNYGMPGHEHEEGNHEGEEIVRIDLKQTRLDLKGGWVDLAGPVEAINMRFGINDYRHNELEGAEIGTAFENRAYEGRVEFLHTPWGEWDGAIGVQFGERQFSVVGEEAFIPPIDTRNVGLFLLEEREFDRWNLSLGGRLESQKHSPSSSQPAVSDTAASASFASIRRLSDDYALALHLAVSQRLPVAEELYANGPHLASSMFERGDSSLGKETSRHVDIGIRKTTGPMTWSFTAFYTSFADFIFLGDTGTKNLALELPIFAYNQQDANVSGFEVELFTPIANIGMGELDLRVYADSAEGDLDSGGYLPRLPPLRVGARLQYHDEKLVLGLELARYSQQDSAAAFETLTPGYTMANTDLNWMLPASRSEIEMSLFFRGINLLNEDARRHTSLVKDIAPLPGRNFLFGMRAMF